MGPFDLPPVPPPDHTPAGRMPIAPVGELANATAERAVTADYWLNKPVHGLQMQAERSDAVLDALLGKAVTPVLDGIDQSVAVMDRLHGGMTAPIDAQIAASRGTLDNLVQVATDAGVSLPGPIPPARIGEPPPGGLTPLPGGTALPPVTLCGPTGPADWARQAVAQWPQIQTLPTQPLPQAASSLIPALADISGLSAADLAMPVAKYLASADMPNWSQYPSPGFFGRVGQAMCDICQMFHLAPAPCLPCPPPADNIRLPPAGGGGSGGGPLVPVSGPTLPATCPADFDTRMTVIGTYLLARWPALATWGNLTYLDPGMRLADVLVGELGWSPVQAWQIITGVSTLSPWQPWQTLPSPQRERSVGAAFCNWAVNAPNAAFRAFCVCSSPPPPPPPPPPPAMAGCPPPCPPTDRPAVCEIYNPLAWMSERCYADTEAALIAWAGDVLRPILSPATLAETTRQFVATMDGGTSTAPINGRALSG